MAGAVLATQQYVEVLESRIADLERALIKMSSPGSLPLPSDVLRKYNEKFVEPQKYKSLYVGYVIDTRDPWKIGRVKAYVPMIHDGVKDEDIPWASPGHFHGSLDECGDAGAPPEGSTIYIMFELGNMWKPVYFGCTWNVTRKADVPFKIDLEDKRWEKRREEDHNTAMNPDPLQLFPPWNNESYDGPDLYIQGKPEDSINQTSPVRPHIYGRKTPEKHFLQMVDGCFEKGLKGKRLVLQSSRGNVFFMKDDTQQTAADIYDNKNWDDFHDQYPSAKWRVKPFNDHAIELDQLGVQIQTVAGARLIMDDKTEKPPDGNGNEWDSGWDPKGKILSRVMLESVTEHLISLSDSEAKEKLRSSHNGIFLRSAGGSAISISDHESSPSKGGSSRGIRMVSTAGHALYMSDNGVPLKGRQERARVGEKFSLDAFPAEEGTKIPKGYVLLKNTMGSQLMLHNKTGIMLRCYNKSYVMMHQERPNLAFVAYSSAHMIIRAKKTLSVQIDGDIFILGKQNIHQNAMGKHVSSSTYDQYHWSKDGKIYILTGGEEGASGNKQMPVESALHVAVGPTALCMNFVPSSKGYPHYKPAEKIFGTLK